jgi:hypothetical protein
MMQQKEINKKKLMDEIVANDFAKLNGAIVRTLGNILGAGWQKATDLIIAFRDEDESAMYFSLEYLQQCGVIAVREIESQQPVEIYDFDLDDVQIRLTADGIKMLMCRKKDELIEI